MDSPTLTTTSEPAVEALHALRIGGGSGRDDLVARAGAETVDALLADGLAKASGPRVVLTPAGRAAHEQALAGQLDAAGARTAVADAYERFLPLNDEVLQLCTDWQLRFEGGTPVPNDHADADYDAAVIARLGEVGEGAGAVVARLADALPRFGVYGTDLADAIGRVSAGETDYFTNPRVRCFHTVWFEMHEDLLATLGIDRSSEQGVGM
jgi:hypothetical protein